ncbi:MAG: endonuclease domain-containing protein [candidate division Zixibacteria bacterium]|nr:endonuclease domain-containing protein [candidate division Zixibacteria bacterium]
MKSNITKTAKTLRKKSTKAERLLWRNLRVKQIKGLKFRRQEPLGDYVVDFVCFEKRLVIEVDGGQLMIEVVKDKERERWLKKQEFKILRFWNNEVLTNIEKVLEVIRRNCLFSSPLVGED